MVIDRSEDDQARARRTTRRRRPVFVAFVAAVAFVLGGGAAVATGWHDILPRHPYPTSTAPPREGDAIPNVGVVESTIKNYYGSQTVPAPAALTAALGITTMTEPSATGDYAREMTRIAGRARRLLDHARTHGRKKAVVFDIDDTLLNTYDYEIYSHFAYDPATNAAFVNAAAFPATPGMVSLVNWARRDGYTVFMITGRPESQRDGTVTNLQQVGYTGNLGPNRLFLKNTATPPPYLSCGSTCSTIEYKSGTRAYIESQGYDIVAAFGDQYSDLDGGHADSRVKVPNPMYYLP